MTLAGLVGRTLLRLKLSDRYSEEAKPYAEKES